MGGGVLVLVKFSHFPLECAQTACPHDKNNMILQGKVHMK